MSQALVPRAAKIQSPGCALGDMDPDPSVWSWAASRGEATRAVEAALLALANSTTPTGEQHELPTAGIAEVSIEKFSPLNIFGMPRALETITKCGDARVRVRG